MSGLSFLYRIIESGGHGEGIAGVFGGGGVHQVSPLATGDVRSVDPGIVFSVDPDVLVHPLRSDALVAAEPGSGRDSRSSTDGPGHGVSVSSTGLGENIVILVDGNVVAGPFHQDVLLATNTVSNLVQQMVTAGLVERTPRPGDRRAANLSLTQSGTEILAAWQAANDRRLGQALERLPESYRNAIENAVPALAALAALLEADDEAQNRDQAGQNGTRP
ncbi:hypothetical protein [Arthrobacter sp. SRS-W-1-2016]|uniref:MarR family winged helix-turn-helix transcriptional regulator n=1 Tax=Arthrobacter sp. SRS-W-1-2016 TaxID=1930254 RepID=UPI0015C53859|nr:hypothetical protein [Arthrobacter sp. SRS-W-1-2016]